MSSHLAFRFYIFSDNSHYNCAVMRLQEKIQEAKNEQTTPTFFLRIPLHKIKYLVYWPEMAANYFKICYVYNF